MPCFSSLISVASIIVFLIFGFDSKILCASA
nr:MAG TPA: hypothetical protein [Bacteriophage sp.]